MPRSIPIKKIIIATFSFTLAFLLRPKIAFGTTKFPNCSLKKAEKMILEAVEKNLSEINIPSMKIRKYSHVFIGDPVMGEEHSVFGEPFSFVQEIEPIPGEKLIPTPHLGRVLFDREKCKAIDVYYSQTEEKELKK